MLAYARLLEDAPSRSYTVAVINRDTGSLVLPDLTIDHEVSRSSYLSSPPGAQARCDDVHGGRMTVRLGPRLLDGAAFVFHLHFEGERLHGYSLSLSDARYGSSWDDWSEEKELARRGAHDTWLIAALGEGQREASPRGPELRYALPWGEVWSTFDAIGGSSSIVVRFR